MGRSYWNLSLIVAVFTSFNSSGVLVTGQILCPPEADIRPCECQEFFQFFTCSENSLTQVGINNAIKTVRAFNNGTLSPSMYSFIISDSNMMEFDLAPLHDFKFEVLYISNNQNLSRIIESEFQAGTNPVLVKEIGVTNNDVTDIGLKEMLALTSFKNVLNLKFYGNKFTRLVDGPFSKLENLFSLDLESNGFSDLGLNALLINEPINQHPELRRQLILKSNSLSNDNIHANSGLQSLKYGWTINLHRNQFVYISANKFEPFLKLHYHNELIFDDNVETISNQFICDQRMKWLKNAAEVDPTVEERVKGVYCTNDLPHTIFTTSLV